VFFVEMCVLRAESATNVQAREGVCAKWDNINLDRFTTARSHRIAARTDTDHIRLARKNHAILEAAGSLRALQELAA
jgi:nicotinate-nucleotide pyrophosphorylase